MHFLDIPIKLHSFADRIKHTFMKNITLFFILMLALSACTSSPKQTGKDLDYIEEGELLSLDVNKISDKVHTVNFSELMESVEIIQLDTAREAYIVVNSLSVSENFLLATNAKEAKLFQRSDGKYLSNIGRRGQGPGEFNIVDGGMIDEINGRIYLSDMVADHLIAYDFKGKHLPDEAIRLPNVPSWKEVYLNGNKDSVLVFVSPKEAGYLVRFRERIEQEEDIYVCWQQDLKGNVSQGIPADRIVMPIEANGQNRIYVSHLSPESPIYTYVVHQREVYQGDTLFHYNKNLNLFYPAYTTNFPHNNHSLILSTESPLHYYSTHQVYKEGAQKTLDNMEKCRLVQVDKKTGEARYIRLVNDYLGGLEVSAIEFRRSMKDNFVFIRYSNIWKLKEQLEKALANNSSMPVSVRERITKLKDSLHEDSNDVIVLCTFKK